MRGWLTSHWMYDRGMHWRRHFLEAGDAAYRTSNQGQRGPVVVKMNTEILRGKKVQEGDECKRKDHKWWGVEEKCLKREHGRA